MNATPMTRFAGGLPPSWAVVKKTTPMPDKPVLVAKPIPVRAPVIARLPVSPLTQFKPKKAPMKVVAKPASKAIKKVDVSNLVIEDTPYDPKWRLTAAKSMYDSTFSALKDGQCVRSKPSECACIADAMRSWFDKRGFSIEVVQVRKGADGYGRVWLMKRTPMKDKPNTEVQHHAI